MLLMFFNLEKYLSAHEEDCKCSEPCETMKYRVSLSYGAFPGLASAKQYQQNGTKKVKNLTYVTFQYLLFLKDARIKILPIMQIMQINLKILQEIAV